MSRSCASTLKGGASRKPSATRNTRSRARTAAVAGFATPTRRVELYSELMLGHGYDPLPDHVEPDGSPLSAAADERFPLVLSTAKSGWFVHSSYRHVASLRRKSPDPAVEISPRLAERRGLAEGDLGGARGARRRRAPESASQCGARRARVVVAEFGTGGRIVRRSAAIVPRRLASAPATSTPCCMTTARSGLGLRSAARDRLRYQA